jgi:hypothetical protein
MIYPIIQLHICISERKVVKYCNLYKDTVYVVLYSTPTILQTTFIGKVKNEHY